MVELARQLELAPRSVTVRMNLPAGAGGSPTASAHPVVLRGLDASPEDKKKPPVIVRRTETEFIPALFADLSQRADLSTLGLPDVGASDDYEGGVRRLFQPVHRSFNCVLFEACCQRPGFPRLDPQKVDSAGCVVRRVTDRSRSDLDEAWLHYDGAVLGWCQLPSGFQQLDPNPKFRVRSPLAVNRHLHSRLADLLTPTLEGVEPVSPIFVAPPEVGDAAGKTILYGVVPVTSSEERSRPRTPPTDLTKQSSDEDEVDVEVVTSTSPGFLRDLGQKYGQPLVNSVISPKSFNEALNTPDSAFVGVLSASQTALRALKTFASDLRMMAIGWRVFDDTPEARNVIAKLNDVAIDVARAETPSQVEKRALGDFLGEAVRRLVLESERGDVLFPGEWSQPPTAKAQAIRDAVRSLLTARHRTTGLRLKRFDEPTALYRLHCFVRVRGGAGCPPELHWTEPSAVFSIVPWWESSGVPVHTISLPDLNADNFKRLKPNVAFVLPPRLAAALNIDPQTLLDGKDPGSPSIGLGWICSFSIPIITLCAFLVLNLFLGLFKLVFSFIFGFSFGFSLKICLPFPKVNSPPRP